MEAATCPFGAAAPPRARRLRGFSPDTQRVLSLLAMSFGFVIGYRLGIGRVAGNTSCDSFNAVIKLVPLLAAAIALLRQRPAAKTSYEDSARET